MYASIYLSINLYHSGVGYSYNSQTPVYTTGDDDTAEDNLALISAFYDRFPEYRTNDLYISSESYGGRWVGGCIKHQAVCTLCYIYYYVYYSVMSTAQSYSISLFHYFKTIKILYIWYTILHIY